MLPRSDDVEALHARAKFLSTELKKLGSTEVHKPDLKTQAAALARDWLRVSPALRNSGICAGDKLDSLDQAMKDLLSSTTSRARASALRSKVDVVVEDAVDAIVVPLIKFEGSPRQVAARQIQSTFPTTLTADEALYVEEAARCVTVQCYRAGIIMLWAGAIARLHAAVIKSGFDTYNKAVDATIARKGSPFNRIREGSKISSLPELQKSRDADLIVVGMELFSYDLQVFQELNRLLGIRNDAAHPGMGTPGALDVQQFASKLASLVFDRVSV